MKTLLLGLLFIYIQPSWASYFVWNLTIGSEVKVVGDEEVSFPAGDWACVLTKNHGFDKKEIRQVECSLGGKENVHLPAVCEDFAPYDRSVTTLLQKKGDGITVGLSCSAKR